MKINNVSSQQSFKALNFIDLERTDKEFKFLEKAAKGFLKEPIKALEDQRINFDVFRSRDTEGNPLKAIDILIFKDNHTYNNEFMYKTVKTIKEAQTLLSKLVGKAIGIASQ